MDKMTLRIFRRADTTSVSLLSVTVKLWLVTCDSMIVVLHTHKSCAHKSLRADVKT